MIDNKKTKQMRREMKKLMIMLLGVALMMCMGGCNSDTTIDEPHSEDRIWMYAGKGVRMRIVTIENHHYLLTLRDGGYSPTAHTIHAASCPCMTKNKNEE